MIKNSFTTTTKILLISLYLISCNSSLAEECPNIDNQISIEVSDKKVEPKVYTDVDISTFNDTSNHSYTKFVLGFTQGGINLSSNLEFKYSKQKDNYCVWLSKIKVSYDISKLDVYIPSDFKNDTCQFREVEKHEFEHVAIYQSTHKEYLEKLKRELNKKNYKLKSNDAILVKDVETAKQIYQEELSEILNKFQKESTNELNKRQAAIDTKENYDRISSRCKNWLNDIKN